MAHRPRFWNPEAMNANTSAEEKRTAVEQLNFGAKTSKRVGWEAWEFRVCGPHQIEVTNAAWGHEKADHSYVVGIEERDGVAVPAECGCKADQYRDDYDCKHKVALASVGGPVVLNAAMNFPTASAGNKQSNISTLSDKLRADGGAITEENTEQTPALDEAEHEDCACDDLHDDFPCTDCYIEGRKEFPE